MGVPEIETYGVLRIDTQTTLAVSVDKEVPVIVLGLGCPAGMQD